MTKSIMTSLHKEYFYFCAFAIETLFCGKHFCIF